MAARAKNAGGKPGEKRVTVRTETVEEREEGGELELEQAGAEAGDAGEDADFLAVLDELGGGGEARVEIRRTSPAEFAGYCCTYARSELSLDRLQEEWGGGKFNFRVRDAKGAFRGSTNVQIAGKAHHRKEEAAPVAAPVASNNSDSMAAMLAAIQAGQKATQDAANGQIALLTTLVTSLITKEPPKPAPPPDPLAMIAALKDVLKPDKGDSGAEAVKLLLQGVTLGKELGGDGGDGGGISSLFAKGLDTVKTLATLPARQRPGAPAKPVARLPAPGTVPAEEPVAAPEEIPIVDPEDPPMLKLLNWVKQQTMMLCHQAARGKDPGLYAALFLDNIPAGVDVATIREKLEAPDGIDQLAFLNADVAKHRAWFEKFREEVIAQLDELSQPEGDEPGASAIEVNMGGDAGEG